MEVVIILAVATGLSAWVVWWALQPPGRTREKPAHPRKHLRFPWPARPRKETPAPAPRPMFQTTGPDPVSDRAGGDGFGVLPPGAPAAVDDRPSRSLSLVRLALAITFVAVLVVAALAVIGFLVKTQLDQYFTG
jgi:hypothetical protein